MLRALRGVEQMNRMHDRLRKCPADHRANRRDRGLLGDKNHLALGWMFDGKRAERPSEIEQVTHPALKHPGRSGTVWDKVETQLERLAIFRAGRNRVRTYTNLLGQWNSDGDKHAGRIWGQPAGDRTQKQGARIGAVIKDSLDPRPVNWSFHRPLTG